MRLNMLTRGGVLAVCAGMACGAEPLVPVDISATPAPEPDPVAFALEGRLFDMLPAAHQAQIAVGLVNEEAGKEGLVPAPATDAEYAKVEHLISREAFDRASGLHRTALISLAERAERREIPLAACFTPGTDAELVSAFSEALFGQAEAVAGFQQTNRWFQTASQPGPLQQGDSAILTYSYVPDGTFVPNLIGFSGSSNLQSWLNGIYGSPATWQSLFDQVFDRWEELSSNVYIYEPNDDGSDLNGLSGQLGVRGDLRIAAISLDGNSGTLAYNNFPPDGDMVFDSADNFYNTTSQNSRRLRNIIAHEHGHGKGMLHVCPISASQPKLMEPFINTSYDGPQLDDILNAQRHYGDPLEPNDSTGQATALGESAFPGTTITQISIDDNGDTDYFSVTVPEPKNLLVNVVPTGETYVQGPQTGGCSTGSTFNSLVVHDLALEILGTDGSTVLAFVDNNAEGQSEGTNVILDDAGTYFIRVIGDGTNSIQAYEISALTSDLPFLPLSLQLNAPAPDQVDPGVTTPVSVAINPRDEVILPGSVRLRFRDSGGAFSSIAMSDQGGGIFAASLPASACDTSPEFFFEVEGDLSGQVLLPAGGASSPFSAVVGDFAQSFADNFQSNMGWSVAGAPNGTDEGEWQRGVPAGAGDRGDPTEDFDGSGSCYLTGNGAGNTDVDGGSTVLTSPAFDVSDNPEAVVSYARWYDNTAGDNPNADIFVVEISNNNGASWTNLEVVGPGGAGTSGGWIEASFRVADFVTPSSQVRVRFTASDLDGGSVVEAAVDAIDVSGLTCEDPKDPQPCSDADLAEPLGILDFNDVVAYLTAFSSGDPAADLASPIGVLDFNDVITYLSLFGAGCP